VRELAQVIVGALDGLVGGLQLGVSLCDGGAVVPQSSLELTKGTG
jgi:hypothetical protein